MKFRPAVVGLLLSACLSTPILGQGDHPNRAAGISTQTLYSSSGTDDCSATIRFPGRVASKADVTVDPRLNRTEARLPQAFRSVLFGRAWGVPTDSEGHRLRGRSRVSSQGRVSGRAVGMWESRRGAKRSRATSTFP